MYIASCHIGAKINSLRQRGITDGKCKFNSAINKLHLVDSTKSPPLISCQITICKLRLGYIVVLYSTKAYWQTSNFRQSNLEYLQIHVSKPAIW